MADTRKNANSRSKSTAKLYMYGGKTQTLKAWSAELGINLVTLYMRLRKGWPLSKVFGQAVDSSKIRKKHEYTWNGKTASAEEWAKITGIPEKVLHYRLTHRKMWTIEKALTTPFSPRTGVCPTSLTLNGETKSIKEWAERLGIKENTLRMRIYRGHDTATVLDPCIKIPCIQKPMNVMFNGETNSLRTWAKKTGISVQTLSSRIHSGWTIKDALTLKVNKPNQLRYKIGEKTKTIAEWAKESGVADSVIRNRLALGWDIKRAVFSPKRVKRQPKF